MTHRSRWNPSWRTALLLLVLLSSAMACKSVLPSRSPAATRSDEITRLKQRVLDLERQARMSEVEIERLKRQLAALEEGRGRADASAERVAPPRSVEAPGRVEPTVDDRPPAPPPAVEEEDLTLSESTREPAPPDGMAPSPAAVGQVGQALYDRGYTLYHQQAYIDAESAFQSFLQQHGASDLADNAQFWIGEARLRRGDLNGALAAFRETVARYPRGNKVPDALFRSGDCLEQLGDREGARAAWRQTIDRFPNTAAAALSEERLAASR